MNESFYELFSFNQLKKKAQPMFTNDETSSARIVCDKINEYWHNRNTYLTAILSKINLSDFWINNIDNITQDDLDEKEEKLAFFEAFKIAAEGNENTTPAYEEIGDFGGWTTTWYDEDGVAFIFNLQEISYSNNSDSDREGLYYILRYITNDGDDITPHEFAIYHIEHDALSQTSEYQPLGLILFHTEIQSYSIDEQAQERKHVNFSNLLHEQMDNSTMIDGYDTISSYISFCDGSATISDIMSILSAKFKEIPVKLKNLAVNFGSYAKAGTAGIISYFKDMFSTMQRITVKSNRNLDLTSVDGTSFVVNTLPMSGIVSGVLSAVEVAGGIMLVCGGPIIKTLGIVFIIVSGIVKRIIEALNANTDAYFYDGAAESLPVFPMPIWKSEIHFPNDWRLLLGIDFSVSNSWYINMGHSFWLFTKSIDNPAPEVAVCTVFISLAETGDVRYLDYDPMRYVRKLDGNTPLTASDLWELPKPYTPNKIMDVNRNVIPEVKQVMLAKSFKYFNDIVSRYSPLESLNDEDDQHLRFIFITNYCQLIYCLNNICVWSPYDGVDTSWQSFSLRLRSLRFRPLSDADIQNAGYSIMLYFMRHVFDSDSEPAVMSAALVSPYVNKFNYYKENFPEDLPYLIPDWGDIINCVNRRFKTEPWCESSNFPSWIFGYRYSTGEVDLSVFHCNLKFPCLNYTKRSYYYQHSGSIYHERCMPVPGRTAGYGILFGNREWDRNNYYLCPWYLGTGALNINNVTDYALFSTAYTLTTANIGFKPPSIDKKGMIASIIIGAVITGTVVFVSTVFALKARKSINRRKAIKIAKIEKAHNALVESPTKENANKYMSLVTRNNILATVTGGTKYSHVNYWDTNESTSIYDTATNFIGDSNQYSNLYYALLGKDPE